MTLKQTSVDVSVNFFAVLPPPGKTFGVRSGKGSTPKDGEGTHRDVRRRRTGVDAGSQEEYRPRTVLTSRDRSPSLTGRSGTDGVQESGLSGHPQNGSGMSALHQTDRGIGGGLECRQDPAPDSLSSFCPVVSGPVFRDPRTSGVETYAPE